jgi:hypothetical protein
MERLGYNSRPEKAAFERVFASDLELAKRLPNLGLPVRNKACR